MKLFLIIVGALVTAFVLCLLIFVAWLRWWLRRLKGSFVDQLGDLAEQVGQGIAPLRIKLRRIPVVQWQRPDEAAALIEPLRQAHFDDIGTFDMQPGEVSLQALCRSGDSIYAIIYEHPQAGVWLDLVTRYQDGSRITYTTIHDTLLERAEDNIVRFYEGMPAGDLLSRFLAERPSKPMESLSADTFVAHFEQAYAESMDWIIARGGPTEEEIRRQCEQRGNEFTPLVVSTIRKLWAAAIENFYNEQLKERFLAEAQLSVARWEEIRDRLVFVHDRLSPDQLEALCEREFEEDDDDGENDAPRGRDISLPALVDGSALARVAFERWNTALGHERRYEKIGQVSEPLAADVYLSPDEED